MQSLHVHHQSTRMLNQQDRNNLKTPKPGDAILWKKNICFIRIVDLFIYVQQYGSSLGVDH